MLSSCYWVMRGKAKQDLSQGGLEMVRHDRRLVCRERDFAAAAAAADG
jgi:hypothetical protein